MTLFARWLALLLSLALSAAFAQTDDDTELGFRKPDAAQVQRFNQLLAEPTPQNLSGDALVGYFWDKELAARILGDTQRREQVLRDAVAATNQPAFKRNLGQLLISKGQFDEGYALMQRAAGEGGAIENAFSTSTMVCDLYSQNRDSEARALARDVDGKIGNLLRRVRDEEKQVKLWRSASRRDRCLSLLEDRVGHTQQATEYARSAEQYARMALDHIASQSTGASKNGVLIDVASAIARNLQASLAVDRLNDAEKVLGIYVRFSRDYQLPQGKLADLYEQAGHLRFAQRAFAQAETYLRRADSVYEAMGYDPTNIARIKDQRDILFALIGQRKWSVALAELERADAWPVQDASQRSKLQFPQARGLVYLQVGRAAQAVPLLELAAANARAQYGPTHFYTAQANGLWGAALWRSGVAENRSRALPLLKAAVRDYMSAANADFQDSIGIRREVRQLVFGAYLDAAANTSVQEALDAMGPADWARGGVVKDALNDAAVRASASTPALADVVRREQDARNEIAGLRRFLSGELGGAQTPLPQVAAQMRERIAALEEQRSQLQAELKAKFPDYDRLVHPQAPTVQDVARQLGKGQLLLVMLPGADAVYVWAVGRDQPATFHRAELGDTQVRQMVSALRRQLDFGSSASAGTRFDGATAFALYDKLLAPLEPLLADKNQLIVAAGGALSQLPLGLLHTRAGGGFDAEAPWLIRKVAISQVPSLSSWLAIKALGRAQSASQAFAGWADPLFDLQLASAPEMKKATRSVVLSRSAAPVSGEGAEQIAAAAPAALSYAQIPRLPDTRDELQSIAQALKADPGQDLHLGSEATRESVLAASRSGSLYSKRVIAFATHGLMAGDLPNLTQPALALAATGREQQEPLSPLLTLEDVLTLKLNADWVVLSACNSAAEDGRGDEVMSGLARGFFYAGSRSLLVTHWAVESESAMQLTTETFRHYTAHPDAPKAESLRQAMLKVMADPRFQHPAFWAPYALVGDGGR